MSTVENNTLIAKFMGARHYVTTNEFELYGIIQCIEDGEFEQHHFFPSQMKFHSDWNWLMPVVEKIEILCINTNGLEIEFIVTIELKECIISPFCRSTKQELKRFKEVGENKLKATYNACIEFIKWYNQKNS